MKTNAALDEFKAYYAQIDDLKQASSLLGWDQHVYMPEGAAAVRGQQMATLGKVIHEMLSSRKMQDLLTAARQSGVSGDDEVMLERAQRSFDKATKLPSDFVEAFAKQRAKATNIWAQARKQNNFKLFEPELQKVFEFTRQQADYLGFDQHPYDALHDLYEMGSSVAELKPMFAELREETVQLLKAIESGKDINDDPIFQAFDVAEQRELSLDVAQKLGFDFAHGRLDPTVHPFAQDISKYDVRITTRYSETFFTMSLFGTMHEAGHAMYEQGIADAFHRTPLGASISLGVHESQSRLWENLVGRSYSFWQGYYPELQARFPKQLEQLALDDFYAAINKVKPIMIRVEADEVTYNLHILIRFELELALLEGTLAIADLPEAWNEKYEQYLGICPTNDAEGCLQDVHWSEALVGYFPTYTLGNLMSVQLFEAAQEAHPSIEKDMQRSDFSKLLSWLRENVHQHGTKYQSRELIVKATGKALSAKPYIAYLNKKYRALYGV